MISELINRNHTSRIRKLFFSDNSFRPDRRLDHKGAKRIHKGAQQCFLLESGPSSDLVMYFVRLCVFLFHVISK